MRSKTVSVTINAPPARVYAYASAPGNLPTWAPAFCRSATLREGEWVLETAEGLARCAFAPPNPYGVLDHTITFNSGARVTQSMRVTPSGDGSVLSFVLTPLPNQSTSAFEAEANRVRCDLECLRDLLENEACGDRIDDCSASTAYVPPGFGTVTPYLFVDDAAGYVEFLVEAFGGTRSLLSMRPDGKIANAQIRIGTSTLMVSEASAQYPAMASAYYLYVADADQALAKALACGADLEMPVADMPYGDRQGGVRDRTGTIWWLSQRLVHQGYAS